MVPSNSEANLELEILRFLCMYSIFLMKVIFSFHLELVTGLKFTADGKRLISVSGDGYDFFSVYPDNVMFLYALKK